MWGVLGEPAGASVRRRRHLADGQAGRLVLAAAGGRVPGAGLRAWGRGGTVSGSVVVRPSRDLLAKPGEDRWVTC